MRARTDLHRRLLSCLVVATAGACAGEGPAPVAARQAIIGGVVDTWHDYVVGVDNAGDDLDCNGVLVSRRTVLTVAHCPNPTRVFFGDAVLSSSFPARVEIAVAQRVVHPQYAGAPSYANDLALLQLAADAPVQPAPLLREALDNTPGTFTTTPGTTGPSYFSVGFGFTAVGANDYGKRRIAIFPIDTVGPATFDDGTDTFVVDASQFFYKSIGKNQCAGDSGGATFLVRDHVERLAGLLSLGDAKCEVGFDARTDSAQIAAFIQPTIDLFEPGDACRADGTCNDTCNTGGAIVDPDCAASHCKADGVCAVACVLPADPDCPSDGHCATDGVCDKSCTPFDTDCLPACAADGVCLVDCPTPDPDCAVADMSEVVAVDMATIAPPPEGCALAPGAPAAGATLAFLCSLCALALGVTLGRPRRR